MVLCHRYSISILTSLFIALMISAALVVSFRLVPSETMSSPTWKLKYSIPVVQLQKKAVSFEESDHLRAMINSSSAGSSSGFDHSFVVNRTENPRVIRRIGNLSVEEKLELGLAGARAAIRRAARLRRSNLSSTIRDDVVSDGVDVYHNLGAFYQSYTEMERRFKVYVYPDGDVPMTHDGPCKNIYTSEGRFIHEMEHGTGRFRTKDAKRAHVYFMPFSVTWMVKYMYKPYDLTPLKQFVSDYVRLLSTKYPFWNRTHGADHFMIACHDFGPHVSKADPFLYNTSIRVLCNANTSEGFNPQKDVSLPEIHLLTGEISPKLLSPQAHNNPRPHLAFFAGGLHGPIRPILLQHWRNQDKDMLVYEYLPQNLDYYSLLLNSKFCLCPSGFEVASPRIVEAIYAECVPVILSENYALPFSDVLKWEAFSITVEVSEIPRLKEILSSVPEEEYRKLKEGLKAVRKHFVFNQPAKRFDAFHMILHSIWLRRINVRLA